MNERMKQKQFNKLRGFRRNLVQGDLTLTALPQQYHKLHRMRKSFFVFVCLSVCSFIYFSMLNRIS